MSEWPKRISIPRVGGEKLLREMGVGVEVIPADLGRELFEALDRMCEPGGGWQSEQIEEVREQAHRALLRYRDEVGA